MQHTSLLVQSVCHGRCIALCAVLAHEKTEAETKEITGEGNRESNVGDIFWLSETKGCLASQFITSFQIIEGNF